MKGARTDSGQIINNTYIKSSTSSNQGMIACLKVTSGSVKLSVKITSPNAKSKITTYDEYLASDEMAKKRHVFEITEEDALEK